jgi:trigger factor
MNVKVEQVAACRKALHIEVPAEILADEKRKIVAEFQKSARIPGFRPGKAPASVVEKRFEKDIDEETKRQVIPRVFQQALAEQKINAVGFPAIEKVEHAAGASLKFTALVDVAPEFELPNFDKISVTTEPVTVSDDEIENTLKLIQEQHAEFVDVTGRALAMGDFAVISYSGAMDGKPIAERKDFWLWMQPDAFLPAFCEQLVGATVGEKRQVLVNFPADFAQKELAGRNATYFVTVSAVKEKKLPPVDDKLAAAVGLKTSAELRDEVKKSLESQRKERAVVAQKQQIAQYLLENAKFELPPSMLEHETRHAVYDIVQENAMRGVPKEAIAEKRDEIFGHAAKTAEERLRLSFILQKIAEKEKIEVTEKEVRERIARLAQQYQTTPERLADELEKRDQLHQIEEQILAAKTLDFILSRATIIEKPAEKV